MWWKGWPTFEYTQAETLDSSAVGTRNARNCQRIKAHTSLDCAGLCFAVHTASAASVGSSDPVAWARAHRRFFCSAFCHRAACSFSSHRQAQRPATGPALPLPACRYRDCGPVQESFVHHRALLDTCFVQESVNRKASCKQPRKPP